MTTDTPDAVVNHMAAHRDVLREHTTQAVQILKLKRRNQSMVAALGKIEASIRLSPHAAAFVDTLNVIVAARDDERMGWSER